MPQKSANYPGFSESSAVVATLADVAGRIRPLTWLQSPNHALAIDGTSIDAGVTGTTAIDLAKDSAAMAARELDFARRARPLFDRLVFGDAIGSDAVTASTMDRPNPHRLVASPALIAANHSRFAAMVPTMSTSANSRPRPHMVEVDSSE